MPISSIWVPTVEPPRPVIPIRATNQTISAYERETGTMNKQCKSKAAIALAIITLGVAWAEEPVFFPDTILKNAVESELWISDPTPTEMLDLTSLTCIQTFATQDSGIRDLSGLSSATNLQTLNLRLNWIGTISPLSALANLQTLNLSQNRISDLSPLSGLTSLRNLNVHGNRITSLSALSGLTNLQDLNIRINDISDLTPLSGLTALTTLDAKYAKISDLAPLANLTNLRILTLPYNDIRSVTPLAGLNALEHLYLQDNQISDISSLVGLPNLKVLDLRDNDLNEQAYTSHLEAIYGESMSVGIKYDPNPRWPSDVQSSDGIYQDKVRITWQEVPNGPHYTTYYRIARAASGGNKSTIGEWQTAPSFEDTTANPKTRYTYWVQTATSVQGDNESAYWASDTGWCSSEPALTLASTAGGSVVTPGEGTYAYDMETMVSVVAAPVDPTHYVFAGWTGTAIEAGKVTDPGRASTTVDVDGVCTLKAHFLTTMDTLYVDNAVSSDFEDGTAQAPFDTIQEAIDVASEGVAIVVRRGTYAENIDLDGRNIYLTGIDPNKPNEPAFPIIDGNDSGPVLSFTHGEDPNCIVTGFVLTGGKGPHAGAILCSGSGPTIANCLIVGNRTTDPDGAAIYCTDSNALFTNCTVADNCGGERGGGFHVVDSNMVLVNFIIWNNTPNEIVVSGESEPLISYSNVLGGWPGLGNLDMDPLFTRRGHWADSDDLTMILKPHDLRATWIDGDYHLRSQAGRWHPETQNWAVDAMTSPCIDSGDPLCPVEQERPANDDIINMGAYGGTAQASKSH